MRDELIVEKIKQAIKILDEIDELISTQPEELQKIDYELSDWYHYIENNTLDDATSINIIKRIKELRIIRRGLHREHDIETAYKNNSSKMMGNNTRALLLAEINKTIKQLDTVYKNRIITDEDLKTITEKNKKKVGRPKKEST
jgi:hypothetical protein